MDPIIGGALIAGGANLLGGILGQDSAKEAAYTNAVINERNEALQREFAQHGVRWKVEDAKAAGIHPLAALGAATTSYSPTAVGAVADDSMPRALSAVGQDIGRAVAQTRTAEEKEISALQLAAARLDVEGKAIDNQVRARALSNAGLSNPAFPGSTNFMPGQGNSPLVKVNPSERTASEPGRPSQEAGWVPDVGYSRTDTGLFPVVPKSLSESLEDDVVGKLMWRLRNQIVPNFDPSASRPPASQLPKGADEWRWSTFKQEWQPYYKNRYDRYSEELMRKWKGGK